ncbi:catenin delta-2-like [Ptychodera flava]|uniref:catenin delta-2-like n=1 Tax=Ptychodera flava TaxID=63121 RepID=UPI003969D1F7
MDHPLSGHYLPNPDEMSLVEVVRKLCDQDYTVVASMVAYLERVTEGKDSRIIADIREYGGIPAIVDLLGHPIPDIHHSAANILRNIAFRQPNEDNNLAVKNSGGIQALARLLRTTSDEDIREITTGTLWNLSSDEVGHFFFCSAKGGRIPILEDSLTILVKTVLISESGWERNKDGSNLRIRNTPLSVTFTNSTGCLRNLSSAGPEARKKMRECEGLVDSLIYLMRSVSDSKSNALLDSNAVENCMCILQNLSYHIGSEVFHRESPPAMHPKNESQEFKIGCFSFGKQTTPRRRAPPREDPTSQEPRQRREQEKKGKSLLWQVDVCQPYLSLLSVSSNIGTLAATAGTIQNLTAPNFKWSIDIRADVRKSKGLPILVELLKMDDDAVVNSVAKALHNLSQDPRNKELVGRYGMRDLIMCMPGGAGKPVQHKADVVVAVIHCVHRLVINDFENAKELRNLNGVDKLINISSTWRKYSVAEVAAASQVLITLWSFKKLRPVFKKDGWNSQYFHPHVHTQSQARPGTNAEDECSKCNTCQSNKDSIEQEGAIEMPHYQRIHGLDRITDDEDDARTYDTTTTETAMRDSEYYTETIDTETTGPSVYVNQLSRLKYENQDFRVQMKHIRKELDRVSYHNVELMQQLSQLERRQQEIQGTSFHRQPLPTK